MINLARDIEIHFRDFRVELNKIGTSDVDYYIQQLYTASASIVFAVRIVAHVSVLGVTKMPLYMLGRLIGIK